MDDIRLSRLWRIDGNVSICLVVMGVLTDTLFDNTFGRWRIDFADVEGPTNAEVRLTLSFELQ